MASTSDILGQAKPTSGTLHDLYTVPSDKGCITCPLVACNQDPADDAVTVKLAKNGASDDATQFLLDAVAVSGGSWLPIGIPFGLGPGDVVRVKSANGTTSFTVSGVEMDRP